MGFLQVANESGMNTNYLDKFKAVAAAVWAVDPKITLVTTGNTHKWNGRENPEEMRKRLAVHLDLTRWMKEQGKPLVWDVHAFNTGEATDQPRTEGAHTRGLIEFSRWLTRLDPSLGPVPVANFEFNAGSFDHRRGLQHATELNVLHRAGDVVIAGAMPNTSQPWNIYQSDWKAVLWTQGSIYYNQERVWFQSSYLVDQMISRNWTPIVVSATSETNDLDVLAGRAENPDSLVLRVVNHADHPVSSKLDIAAWPMADQMTIEDLVGELGEFNSLKHPTRLHVEHRVLKTTSIWVFPPHSFSILRWANGAK